MKHIGIVAGSLDDQIILTPLMKTLQKDPDLTLSMITTQVHKTPEMIISTRRIEEEGFLVDEQTDIRIRSNQAPFSLPHENFGHLNYQSLFKHLNPDILVLFGSSKDTYSAAVAATLSDIPVAHIQGGESAYRDWDESYGFGITKLSHLHFTASSKYRDQVIRFGEHPDRVFNTGSLLADQVRNLPYQPDSDFYDQTGIEPEKNFLLIALNPDLSLGSKNNYLFEMIHQVLIDQSLSEYKLVFCKPETTGLGKMFGQMVDDFCEQHPDRAIGLADIDLALTAQLVKRCDLIIGNSATFHTMASTLNKPVIHVGNRRQDLDMEGNTHHCRIDPKQILTAVQNGLSLAFDFTQQGSAPVPEQDSTARKITDVLAGFEASDICQKAYYIE